MSNKKLLLLGIVILSINLVYAQDSNFYNVNLFYEGHTLHSNGVDVKYNLSEISHSNGDFYYMLISNQNSLLFKSNFSIPLIERDYYLDNATGQIYDNWIFLNETNFTLEIPYFDNAKDINFYDSNVKVLLSTGIEGLKRTLCGDLVCQSNENDQTCPSDCTIEDVLIRQNQTTNLRVYALSAFAVIAMVFALFFILRKKKQKK